MRTIPSRIATLGLLAGAGCSSSLTDASPSTPGGATPATSITVSANTVSFSMFRGGPAPASQTIQVSASGGGAITGLATSVAYTSGGANGWLDAGLNATTSPTSLRLATDAGKLTSGNYTAVVKVTGGLNVEPGTVIVTLTVIAPPIAPLFPLSAERRWRYSLVDSTVVVATGVTRTGTVGSLVLQTVDQSPLGGRSAWRLDALEFNDAPSASAQAFTAYSLNLSMDADGLSRYVDGRWRPVLTSAAAFGNGTLVVAGVPRTVPDITLATGAVTVPAGSYQTTRATQYHREGFAQYSPQDVEETRVEHFAEGVGSVFASSSFYYQPHPTGTAVFSNRILRLTHIDAGPFPSFSLETSAHASAATAQALIGSFAVASGTVAVDDPGAILTDAGVGCTAVCVYPTTVGDKKIHDWYRISVTGTATIRLDLAFPMLGVRTDLDLYLFQSVNGSPRFVASSLNAVGSQDWIQRTLAPGTYYVGVQASDTPDGPSRYWLAVRAL
jgi:Bacterial pre-peptidase C-terminal domain